MDADAALLLFDELEGGNISIPELSESDLSCGEESDGSSAPERDESDTDDDTQVSTDGDTGGVRDNDDDCDDARNAPGAGEHRRERERSPLASRSSRGTGRGRARGRGQERGRVRGRAAGGQSRCRITSGRRRGQQQRVLGERGRRGRTVSVDHSLWNAIDPNPQEIPEFNPDVAVGPQLPPHFAGKNEIDFFKLFFTTSLVSEIARF